MEQETELKCWDCENEIEPDSIGDYPEPAPKGFGCPTGVNLCWDCWDEYRVGAEDDNFCQRMGI